MNLIELMEVGRTVLWPHVNFIKVDRMPIRIPLVLPTEHKVVDAIFPYIEVWDKTCCVPISKKTYIEMLRLEYSFFREAHQVFYVDRLWSEVEEFPAYRFQCAVIRRREDD